MDLTLGKERGLGGQRGLERVVHNLSSGKSSQWVLLHINNPQNPLEGFLKYRLLGPTPGVSHSAGLRGGSRFCMSDKSPCDAVSGPHFIKHVF